MKKTNLHLTAQHQQVPRFNNDVTYFIEEMEYTPGDYAVVGYNPMKKMVYYTLFTGKEAKERAIEYRDFKNGVKDAGDKAKFGGSTEGNEQNNQSTESGDNADPNFRGCGDKKYGEYGSRDYGC